MSFWLLEFAFHSFVLCIQTENAAARVSFTSPLFNHAPPLSVPLMDYSGWHYNVSCCKEAIVGMRIAEVACMAVATILTVIFILAQIRTKASWRQQPILVLCNLAKENVLSCTIVSYLTAYYFEYPNKCEPTLQKADSKICLI